eukprot:CAMPEP_0198245602 /NCGR_PEP_ID=MMETSP1446-20131203/41866_1 /TAXON_ID=1461542 ORGANISM="Unidentified sp, Strain CCMP2111" /NCGR_SAMPLE_ID=MMETSP1446 /ASSEMBLY_ACC=CAM_ASM_001112 /LENGTH=168 /DNA_ID=CAMNT_0043929815 /DNA_START=79 /DNA_END=582 /DNA_ORIENTATION=-
MRSLHLTSLNASRIRIAYEKYNAGSKSRSKKNIALPDPKQMAKLEHILFLPRFGGKGRCFRIVMGAHLKNLVRDDTRCLADLIDAYCKEKYLMGVKGTKILVCLMSGIDEASLLKAYVHALALQTALTKHPRATAGAQKASEDKARVWMSKNWVHFHAMLRDSGWDLK